MSKYQTYDERNKHGCCAVTRCEAKLKPDDTWINSLNNNKYCGTCTKWFYRNHDRFATGNCVRHWTRMKT